MICLKKLFVVVLLKLSNQTPFCLNGYFAYIRNSSELWRQLVYSWIDFKISKFFNCPPLIAKTTFNPLYWAFFVETSNSPFLLTSVTKYYFYKYIHYLLLLVSFHYTIGLALSKNIILNIYKVFFKRIQRIISAHHFYFWVIIKHVNNMLRCFFININS